MERGRALFASSLIKNTATRPVRCGGRVVLGWVSEPVFCRSQQHHYAEARRDVFDRLKAAEHS